MSEKIIIEDKAWDRWDIPQVFLFRAMSEVTKTLSETFKTENKFPLNLEVCLTINGVEVSFVEAVTVWHKMFEDYKEKTIKKEAIALLGEKGQKLFDLLDEITAKVKDNLQIWEET